MIFQKYAVRRLAGGARADWRGWAVAGRVPVAMAPGVLYGAIINTGFDNRLVNGSCLALDFIPRVSLRCVFIYIFIFFTFYGFISEATIPRQTSVGCFGGCGSETAQGVLRRKKERLGEKEAREVWGAEQSAKMRVFPFRRVFLWVDKWRTGATNDPILYSMAIMRE
jgi:hypothetical protein